MLHVRTRVGAQVVEAVRAAWDRLAASDPGLSVVDFASAITLSMMAPFLMREPTLRQRQRTLMVLPLPVAAAAAVTTALQGHGIGGDSAFLLLVFGCFLLAGQDAGPAAPLAACAADGELSDALSALDRSVGVLAERLEVGAVAGFALDG